MREDQLPEPSLSPPVSFTSAEYAKLCENEYFRYLPNSDVIAHVLVSPFGPALQFKLPDHTPGLEAPLVGELSDVMQFKLPNNKITLFGMVGQTQMISRRAYSIAASRDDEDPVPYTFYPLSPKKNPVTQEDRSIIYDTTPVDRFRDTEEAHDVCECNPLNIKTSGVLDITNEDVRKRMAMPRKPDQNTVMTRNHQKKSQRCDADDEHEPKREVRSAVVEMRVFLEKYRSILSDDLIHILERSVTAPLNSREEGQARGEWLHRNGHNLHGLDIDPQRADNLGAAEKRFNTEMMIGERTVQHFALRTPASKSKIKCDFEMLLDSEVINQIHFLVWIQIANFKFKMEQHIDVFQSDLQCVKASDLATLVGIIYSLMNRVAPQCTLPIREGRLDAVIPRFSGNFFHQRREDTHAPSQQVDAPRLRQ